MGRGSENAEQRPGIPRRREAQSGERPVARDSRRQGILRQQGGLRHGPRRGKRRLQLRELAVANAAREGGQGREARRELARTRERLGDLALVDHDEVGEGLA